jgi:hypothetical protein
VVWSRGAYGAHPPVCYGDCISSLTRQPAARCVASSHWQRSTACCSCSTARKLLLAELPPGPLVSLPCRDLLRAYSTLQRFQVAPSGNLEGRSVCYSGRLLLEQFGTPYATDAKTVEAAYPWLRTFGAGELRSTCFASLQNSPVTSCLSLATLPPEAACSAVPTAEERRSGPCRCMRQDEGGY